MKNIFRISNLILATCLLMSSCYYNPSMMLKTDKDYKFTDFPDSTNAEYVFSVNDKFTFQLFYNDGLQVRGNLYDTRVSDN